jgi:hypothetical protein
MVSDPDVNFPRDYRGARKAFIAACQDAHADPISRVHPKLPGPDGKPLFIDSTALGPRDAKKAILIIADGAKACAVMSALLLGGVAPPANARLVLVHAFDPFSFAGTAKKDPAWSLAMLRAVATEDLAQVTDLTVLALETPEIQLAELFGSEKPGRRFVLKQLGTKSGIAALHKMVMKELSRA